MTGKTLPPVYIYRAFDNTQVRVRMTGPVRYNPRTFAAMAEVRVIAPVPPYYPRNRRMTVAAHHLTMVDGTPMAADPDDLEVPSKGDRG